MNALSPTQRPDEASAPTGGATRPDTVKAEAMIEALSAAGQQSTAEMLQQLRRTFPHSPLAFRVRALEALRRR